MLVHRMVKKVKDSKVLAKIGMKDYEMISGQKLSQPGWYLVDGNDRPIDGPYSEAQAKKKAEKIGREAAYFSDYDIRNFSRDSKMKDATNYNRERSFQTFEAWKRACKQINPSVVFEGDKDICQAKPGIGEWDGNEGIIYTKDSKIKVKDSIKSRFNFKKVRDFDDNNVFTMQGPKTKMYKVWNNKQLVGIYSSESEADNVADYQRRLNSKKTNDAMSKEEAIKAFKELEDKRDKAKKAGNQSEAARLDKEIDALFNREAGFKDGVFTSEGVPLNIAYKYGRWDAESGKSKEEHPFKIGSPQHNEWLKGYEFEKRFKSKDSEIRDVIELKKSDAPDDQFDAEQLAMGIKVEQEHTDDLEIAKAIAKAHLSEIKDYYTRLAKMESEAKG